jgi:hypothetical protein
MRNNNPVPSKIAKPVFCFQVYHACVPDGSGIWGPRRIPDDLGKEALAAGTAGKLG